MALTKRRHSRSRGRLRRNAREKKIVRPTLTACAECGALIEPHCACAKCGAFKGKRQVIKAKSS